MTDFDPKLPNNGLPLLPPPAELIETTEILKKCIDARVALAELKQAAELIPNAAVLAVHGRQPMVLGGQTGVPGADRSPSCLYLGRARPGVTVPPEAALYVFLRSHYSWGSEWNPSVSPRW